MEQGKIKQGFTQEKVATLYVGARRFKIEYDRTNDVYELLEKVINGDVIIKTGDLFEVVNYLLQLYDNNK